MEEVFDAHLAQNAALLVMRVGEDVDEIDTEHAPVLHKYAKRLSFQVWKHGRKLLLHSADAPATRFSAKRPGLLDGDAWRAATGACSACGTRRASTWCRCATRSRTAGT